MYDFFVTSNQMCTNRNLTRSKTGHADFDAEKGLPFFALLPLLPLFTETQTRNTKKKTYK